MMELRLHGYDENDFQDFDNPRQDRMMAPVPVGKTKDNDSDFLSSNSDSSESSQDSNIDDHNFKTTQQ